jgi:hypothetical protein
MEADEAGEVYRVSPVPLQIFFSLSQICPYDFAFRAGDICNNNRPIKIPEQFTPMLG